MSCQPFAKRPDDALIADVLAAFGIVDLDKVYELTMHDMLAMRTWARLEELKPRLGAVYRQPGHWNIAHDEASSMRLLRHFLKLVRRVPVARWRYCRTCGNDRVYTVAPAEPWTGIRVHRGPVCLTWNDKTVLSC